MKALYFIFPVLLIGCSLKTKQASLSIKDKHYGVETGPLIINEYSPKGKFTNEFNEPADWIELYNSGEEDIQIGANEWSVSDDPEKEKVYFLPEILIPAGGYLVLWCDGRDTVAREIHTDFHLSGKGESICLFKGDQLLEEVSYGSVSGKGSYGRVQDGHSEWKRFKQPTPGGPNQLSDNYAEALK